LERARALRDSGATDSAFAEYRRVITGLTSQDHEKSVAWWEIAREAEEVGRWREAHEAYENALEELNYRPEYDLRDGLLFLAERDTSKAMERFEGRSSPECRFWWSLCGRGMGTAGADSILGRMLDWPGLGEYYVESARETLRAGPPTLRTPEPSARAINESTRLAFDLSRAGLADDEAVVLDGWQLLRLSSAPLADGQKPSPPDAILWCDILRASGRFAAASREARSAMATLPRQRSADSTEAARWALYRRVYVSGCDAAVEAAARDPRIRMNPMLLRALIWQESRFDSSAVSRAGARGLTQLMPATAAQIARLLHERAPSDSLLIDPALNARYGARHLRQLLDHFHGNVPMALAAYNAGIPAVERWLRLVPGASNALFIEMIAYDETRDYVKNILGARAAYRALLAAPATQH